jgi:hypothetical protein
MSSRSQGKGGGGECLGNPEIRTTEGKLQGIGNRRKSQLKKYWLLNAWILYFTVYNDDDDDDDNNNNNNNLQRLILVY